MDLTTNLFLSDRNKKSRDILRARSRITNRNPGLGRVGKGDVDQASGPIKQRLGGVQLDRQFPPTG